MSCHSPCLKSLDDFSAHLEKLPTPTWLCVIWFPTHLLLSLLTPHVVFAGFLLLRHTSLALQPFLLLPFPWNTCPLTIKQLIPFHHSDLRPNVPTERSSLRKENYPYHKSPCPKSKNICWSQLVGLLQYPGTEFKKFVQKIIG